MAERGTRNERRADSTDRILAAAQAEFAERGMNGATIRGIAKRAGVDPSLVLQRYGSKQGLFTIAVHPADDLQAEDAPEHLAEVLELRMRELAPATEALLRSAPTTPEAAAVMQEYLQDRVRNLAAAIRTGTERAAAADVELRSAILVSSLLGLTIARHLFGLEILAELDRDRIEKIAAPWLASLLTETPEPCDAIAEDRPQQ